MCGIVGLIVKGASVEASAIAEATALLYKRGPDDSGVWTEGGVGLGHRRLSILDLSAAAHQPMISADGRYVIVFNGEIYNFLEIRAELCADESGWRTRSDTEMILAAYAKWGPDCVKRFHGMFALAIWDRHEKVLFAARDRMGVKPFYYHCAPGILAFASRPRALFAAAPDIPADVDEQALRYYLGLGYIPAPWTYHRSVRKLPPAHYLLWRGGELILQRYWDFASIEPERAWARRSEDDLLDELDEIVARSVKSRMLSDVPLGAFLSGGIDSSLVVALMSKHASGPVKTFTIAFEEAAFDESPEARAVADHLGTDHYCETLKVDDLLDLMPTFLAEYDEPFFDYSAFPTMAVSRLARKHVTVSLSGDGGDELFGGYHYYRIAEKLSPMFRMPAAVRQGLGSLVGLAPGHNLKLLGAAMRQDDSAGVFAFSRSIAKDFGEVLTPDLIERTRGIGSLFSQAASRFPAGLTTSEQAMRLDASFTLPDDYLQKVDLASMAFSLEAREPLLDQDLVEWAMKLPVDWKLRAGTNKYLLRRLAYRYVPQAILDRPKRGFAAPMDSWLRGPLRGWAQERFNDRTLFSDLPLDQRSVTQLLKLHLGGTRNAHPLLWAILMLLEHASGLRSAALAA